MLILKNIYKKYNRKYVLKDINLNFKETGLVTILGESGSGKTTLLNILSGIDEPTKGTIYIDRKLISILKKDNSLYNQYISFIFQNYNLIEKLSINDNIKLINDIKTDNILKKFKLLSKKQSKINELSGGMQQRVALARGLVKDKKIIVCDEPTGALDKDNSKIVMTYLKKISKDRLVIVVTHNIELANLYSDRIITLSDGRIISDTSPLELKERKSDYKKIKEQYSIKNLLKIVIKNILSNKKRNIMMFISLVIGILSLMLVLGISNGFKTSIDKEEKTTLASFPLIINEYSQNPLDELSNNYSNINYNNDKITSINKIHKNVIDDNLIKYIDNNTYTKYIYKKYVIDDISISNINNNIEEELIIKSGKYPTNNKELLLVTDEQNNIDKNLLNELGLYNDEYNIDELIGYKVKINKTNYEITAIASFKNNSFFYEETGLFMLSTIDELPYEIYLYPYNYEEKIKLITYLNDYKDLKYLDQTDTVKEVLTTLINSITVVLIVFSIIILLVSSIMLYTLTYISIIERFREISIYKVNGIRNCIIKLIFYLENIFISSLAILSSYILLSLLSLPINKILFDITSLSNILLITPNLLTKAIIMIIILVLISTYIPLKKLNYLNIIDIMKNN